MKVLRKTSTHSTIRFQIIHWKSPEMCPNFLCLRCYETLSIAKLRCQRCDFFLITVVKFRISQIKHIGYTKQKPIHSAVTALLVYYDVWSLCESLAVIQLSLNSCAIWRVYAHGCWWEEFSEPWVQPRPTQRQTTLLALSATVYKKKMGLLLSWYEASESGADGSSAFECRNERQQILARLFTQLCTCDFVVSVATLIPAHTKIILSKHLLTRLRLPHWYCIFVTYCLDDRHVLPPPSQEAVSPRELPRCLQKKKYRNLQLHATISSDPQTTSYSSQRWKNEHLQPGCIRPCKAKERVSVYQDRFASQASSIPLRSCPHPPRTGFNPTKADSRIDRAESCR